MDATTFLQVDHEAQKTAIRALTDTSVDSGLRRMAFRSLRDALEMHARIEEDVFYPAVMKVRSHAAREAVRSALEDHHVVDGLVAELDQRDVDDPQFVARAAALRAALERHITSEEDGMFAEARIHLTDERLERLGRRMEALQSALRFRGLGASAAQLSSGG